MGICLQKQYLQIQGSRRKRRVTNNMNVDSGYYQKVIKDMIDDSVGIQVEKDIQQSTRSFKLPEGLASEEYHKEYKQKYQEYNIIQTTNNFLFDLPCFAHSSRLLKKIDIEKLKIKQSSCIYPKQEVQEFVKNAIKKLKNYQQVMHAKIKQLYDTLQSFNKQSSVRQGNFINIEILRIIMNSNQRLYQIGDSVNLSVQLSQSKNKKSKPNQNSKTPYQMLINGIKQKKLIIDGSKKSRQLSISSPQTQFSYSSLVQIDPKQRQSIQYSCWQPKLKNVYHLSFTKSDIKQSKQQDKLQQEENQNVNLIKKYEPKIIISNSNEKQNKFKVSIPCNLDMLTNFLPKVHTSIIHQEKQSQEMDLQDLQTIGVLIFKIQQIGGSICDHIKNIIRTLETRKKIISDTVNYLGNYGLLFQLDIQKQANIGRESMNAQAYESFMTDVKKSMVGSQKQIMKNIMEQEQEY